MGINITVKNGEQLGVYFERLLNMAKEMNCPVDGTFSNIHITVNPDSSLQDLITAYSAKMRIAGRMPWRRVIN